MIAAVDGYALAGGMELAIACDMIVASKDAKFGIPEAKRGLVAGGGGVVHLPRLLSRQVAMELALTGDPITAQRAYELGLVNRVVDGPALDGAMALARTLAANGPMALVASKGIIRDSWLWPMAEIGALQSPYIAKVFASQDAREGATAFAEKRKPQLEGAVAKVEPKLRSRRKRPAHCGEPWRWGKRMVGVARIELATPTMST